MVRDFVLELLEEPPCQEPPPKDKVNVGLEDSIVLGKVSWLGEWSIFNVLPV